MQGRDFLSETEDIFSSGKEFQSEDFLCSVTPWDALFCADQKAEVVGRIYYAYACVYKITSSLEGNPYIIESVRRKTLWNLHLLISWELSGHFKKKTSTFRHN